LWAGRHGCRAASDRDNQRFPSAAQSQRAGITKNPKVNYGLALRANRQRVQIPPSGPISPFDDISGPSSWSAASREHSAAISEAESNVKKQSPFEKVPDSSCNPPRNSERTVSSLESGGNSAALRGDNRVTDTIAKQAGVSEAAVTTTGKYRCSVQFREDSWARLAPLSETARCSSSFCRQTSPQ
jgi:hypothetical protein